MSAIYGEDLAYIQIATVAGGVRIHGGDFAGVWGAGAAAEAARVFRDTQLTLV